MLRLIVVSLVVAVLVGMLGGWAWLQNAGDQVLDLDDRGYQLMVSRGAGVNLVAENLVENNILKSTIALRLYARFYGLNDIKAGDYHLSKGETLLGLLEKLGTGAVQRYTITFPEGWSLSQWRDALSKAEHMDYTLADSSDAGIAERLGIAYDNPEGWFAPDTYAYISGDSDESILQRAHEGMSDQLEQLWAKKEAGLPYENPYEALIMASIIEKETGVAKERAEIAGVFVSRLRKGMRLQTDPTVIYGLGNAYKGNLTRQHLRQASAYNTYLNNGLPPTPIANPGRAAIESALHPAVTKALFFVGKGDGSHYFSATLEEHNKAVRKYQINRRTTRYRSAPPVPNSVQ